MSVERLPQISAFVASACVRRLRGAASVDSAERRLLFAIIEQAVRESLCADADDVRQAAASFIESGEWFSSYCHWIGLDPEWAREQVEEFRVMGAAQEMAFLIEKARFIGQCGAKES